jgi:hypothetical protein
MRIFKPYCQKDPFAFEEDLKAGVLNFHRVEKAASSNLIVNGVKP